KGDRHHPARIIRTRVHSVGDSMCNGARLTGARPCMDDDRPPESMHRLKLFGVKTRDRVGRDRLSHLKSFNIVRVFQSCTRGVMLLAEWLNTLSGMASTPLTLAALATSA